MTKMW